MIAYSYLRALELEGNHPHDVGMWSSTGLRMMVGEGCAHPLEYTSDLNPDGSFPPAPRLKPELLDRFFLYSRIRTASDCRHFLLANHGMPVSCVCLEITTEWYDPKDGIIPDPAVSDIIGPETHSVEILEAHRHSEKFLFKNSWGKWGYNGQGEMSHKYFDRYVFDAHTIYGNERAIRSFRRRKEGMRTRWSGLDWRGQKWYGVEIESADARADKRMAWAFSTEKDCALEVEEFYVGPEFRGRGYGRELANGIKAISTAKKLPLRLWVPYSDTLRQNPDTYPAMLRICKHLDLKFTLSPVRWAAYLAETDGQSTLPLEPNFFPARPKSTRGALLAAIMTLSAVSNVQDQDDSTYISPTASTGEISTIERTRLNNFDVSFPVPGTSEWGYMNKRRLELIRKRAEVGLSFEEEQLYNILQERSYLAIQSAHPRNLQ